MIAADIRELTRERNTLETDIAQKEADIKIKNGEVKSLQSELDTLAATLKQLENQKGEAQKRLNDLKTQVHYFFYVVNGMIKEFCKKNFVYCIMALFVENPLRMARLLMSVLDV